jgi:hypothetical protein
MHNSVQGWLSPNEWKNIFIAKEKSIIQSWLLWMYHYATEMDDLLRNIVKVLFCPVLFDRRTSLRLEVPSLRPLVLAGMVLTGKKRSIRRQSCRSATLSTTNLTLTAAGSNNKKATVMTPLPSKPDIRLCKEVSSHFTENKLLLPYNIPIH